MTKVSVDEKAHLRSLVWLVVARRRELAALAEEQQQKTAFEEFMEYVHEGELYD